MRLWSFDPSYLDRAGLVALWREALLAQAVLRGRTVGYKSHPQLTRFKQHESTEVMITDYLWSIHGEASERGYNFDPSKIINCQTFSTAGIPVTMGQLEYEWKHFMGKIILRDPQLHMRHIESDIDVPDPNNLVFDVIEGEVEPWERVH